MPSLALTPMDPTLAVVVLILGFGFIIFVHELGHFLVAKWVGIRVTQFAVGFGHALLCWRRGLGLRTGSTETEYRRRVIEHWRKNHDVELTDDQVMLDGTAVTPAQIFEAADNLGLGDTEYRLNWMPLGGYVKMLGQEDLDPTAASDDPRSYNRKPIWARVCVISAGVVMNTIFAVVFFVIAFLPGVAFPPAAIGLVEAGSPAATTPSVEDPNIVGTRPGDELVEVNDEKPSDFTAMQIASALAGPDELVKIKVRRPASEGKPGGQYTFKIKPKVNPYTDFLYVGVSPPVDLTLAGKNEGVRPEDLAPLGLEPGLRLTEVDGDPVQHHWQYMLRRDSAQGRPLELTFAPAEGQTTPAGRKITLEPQTSLMGVDDQPPHLLGLLPLTKLAGVSDEGAAAGTLKADDIVLRIGGTEYPSLDEVREEVSAAGSKAVEMTVARGGKAITVNVTPKRGRIGVVLSQAMDSAQIRGVNPGSPFARLTEGATVLAVDDTPVSSFTQIRAALEAAADGAPTITYRPAVAGSGPESFTAELTDENKEAIAALVWTDNLPFRMLRVPQKADTVWQATVMGVEKTHLFMMQTYVTIARLFQRTVKVKHLRGPVGIIDAGRRIGRGGWSYMMFFLGLISINLAVINFLPLPIVDGGHFVMLMIEKMRGKPVPAPVQSAITLVGLAFLGTLFLVITYYDIARIITGG